MSGILMLVDTPLAVVVILPVGAKLDVLFGASHIELVDVPEETIVTVAPTTAVVEEANEVLTTELVGATVSRLPRVTRSVPLESNTRSLVLLISILAPEVALPTSSFPLKVPALLTSNP
jgi:hypothetical protein